jgi:hypothetical protein
MAPSFASAGFLCALQIVLVLAGIHVACAAAAVSFLRQRSEPQWPLQAAKVLLAGPLALLEVYAAPK